MKKLIAAVLAVMLAVPAVSAWNWPWAQKDEGKLSMAGSTTVLPIAQKAAEEFMKKNPGTDITVSGGGSGVGIASILDGSVDIGNASRSIKTKEIVSAKQKGVNPVGSKVANDGIAVVVNPKNSVSGLTLNQLKGIYSGEIKKWSQVGGSADPIVVISRDSSSGTFEVFNELVLKGSKLSDAALMLASNKELAETVASTPGAIAYVGLAYLSDRLKTVRVDGAVASKASVLDGSYKLSRPLFMYTNGEPSGPAKQFIDFVISDEGQKLVEEVGYVAIR